MAAALGLEPRTSELTVRRFTNLAIGKLVLGAGPGAGPHVRAFTYPGLELLYEFYSDPRTDSNGVFVS